MIQFERIISTYRPASMPSRGGGLRGPPGRGAPALIRQRYQQLSPNVVGPHGNNPASDRAIGSRKCRRRTDCVAANPIPHTLCGDALAISQNVWIRLIDTPPRRLLTAKQRFDNRIGLLASVFRGNQLHGCAAVRVPKLSQVANSECTPSDRGSGRGDVRNANEGRRRAWGQITVHPSRSTETWCIRTSSETTRTTIR